jgi:hypothetical protein
LLHLLLGHRLGRFRAAVGAGVDGQQVLGHRKLLVQAGISHLAPLRTTIGQIDSQGQKFVRAPPGPDDIKVVVDVRALSA